MARAVFVCLLLVTVLAVAASSFKNELLPEDTAYEMITEYRDHYPHPKLPYAYDALEPFVSEETLQVHHQGHHRAYCAKMNAALKEWREQDPESQLAKSSLYDIMRNLSGVPEQWRTTIRNNGGGFVNHIIYFITMRNKVYTGPQGELEEQVNATFGSYEAFMKEFGQAAGNLFGSGYVWLVEDEERKISIISTANQDCPISDGLYPLLVLDVWEHAYYLQHKNKRINYIGKWWSVVHWGAASRLQEWWREVRGDDYDEDEEEYEWEKEIPKEEEGEEEEGEEEEGEGEGEGRGDWQDEKQKKSREEL